MLNSFWQNIHICMMQIIINRLKSLFSVQFSTRKIHEKVRFCRFLIEKLYIFNYNLFSNFSHTFDDLNPVFEPQINYIPRSAKYFVFLENLTFCCPVLGFGIVLVHILKQLTLPACLVSLNSGTGMVQQGSVRFNLIEDMLASGYLPFPILLYYLSMV